MRVSYERRRGCGFRKVGGLYLVSGDVAAPCGKLPLPLEACPACGGGFRQSRGWKWIQPAKLFDAAPCLHEYCSQCPASAPMPERAGLMWVGVKHYPQPVDFTRECVEMGFSKRISQIPKGLELGKSWVFVAHPRAFSATCLDCQANELGCENCDKGWVYKAGVFHLVRASKLEKIVESEPTPEEQEKLDKRGIEAVKVIPIEDDRPLPLPEA